MQTRIDFLIVGAAKSGTTSLHRYLGEHPEIFTPHEKELAIFIKEPSAEQNNRVDSYYASIQPGQLAGLSQVDMLMFPHVPQRIQDHNPHAKIIAILRNPIDRAYSAYWFARMRGWEAIETFEDALQRELDGELTSHYDRINFTYLEHGHYAEQVARFFEQFGQQQVRIVMTDELQSAPSETMSELLQWLGVSSQPIGLNLKSKHNIASRVRFPRVSKLVEVVSRPARRAARSMLPARTHDSVRRQIQNAIVRFNRTPFRAPSMSNETREWLRNYYRPHIAHLESLLNRNLSHWV